MPPVSRSEVVEQLRQVDEDKEDRGGLRVQLEGDGEEAESEEAVTEDVEPGRDLPEPGAGLLLEGEGGEREGGEGEEETDGLPPHPAGLLHHPSPDHDELDQGGRGAVEEGRDGQEVLQAHFLLEPREAGEGGVEGQQEERYQEGGQEKAATQAGLVQGKKVKTEDEVKHDVSQDQQQQD